MTEFKDLLARAEAGDADAQAYLGAMYVAGRGVAQDHVEAVRWYRLAADQGDGDRSRQPIRGAAAPLLGTEFRPVGN